MKEVHTGLTGYDKSERVTQASALIRDQVSSAAPGCSGTGKLHSVPPPEELDKTLNPEVTEREG